MSQSWKHKTSFLVILVVLCCIFSRTESRRTDSRDRDTQRSRKVADRHTALPSTIETVNICSRRRDLKLLCHCTPDDDKQPANKVECWVFQKGLHLNDTVWSGFKSQRGLRHLKFFVQDDGELKFVPTKYLEQLANLTSITIDYSQIRIIKSYAFANLPNLDVITLTNNQIEMVDKDGFANHIFLKEMDLRRNQIKEIDRYAFRNLPILRKLLLDENNISTLHEELFNELGKLEDLSLAHNQISVLTGDMFKGLGNLRNLKMTGNNLNFIGDTVFAELWSLQELELDDNHIERISERALDGLNTLKTLNLRRNILKKLDSGIFRGTPALLSINLQDNPLETLTYFSFQPIMDNLVNSTSELLLSDNKFVCDCRLQWIYELRNRTRNSNLKSSLEQIECTLFNDKQNKALPPVTNNDLTVNVHQFQQRTAGSKSTYYQHTSQLNKKHLYPITSSNDFMSSGISSDDTEQGTGIEYYDDEAALHGSDKENHLEGQQHKRRAAGNVVELFHLKVEDLPCPDELTAPTELPMSRESIDAGAGSARGGFFFSNNGVTPVTVSYLGLVTSYLVYVVFNA